MSITYIIIYIYKQFVYLFIDNKQIAYYNRFSKQNVYLYILRKEGPERMDLQAFGNWVSANAPLLTFVGVTAGLVLFTLANKNRIFGKRKK